MTSEHELTAADMKNCQAMLQVTAPPASNRTLAMITGVYVGVGILALGYYFGLSWVQYWVLGGYALGIAYLMLLAIKLARSKQTSNAAKEYSMKRKYVLSDDTLEIRMEDLTQIIPTKNIERLETGDRATLVHLKKSSPLFLPFGDSFRADFIRALRENIQKRG